MNQTATVDQKTLETILDRLDKLAKELKFIKERLTEIEPPYGSESWWQWSEKKADEEIASGRYKVYKDADGLIQDLHRGK
jgi:hypothetical protein